ncbi:polysaccharide deacetylase family protein [Paenibacillus shirakamiensis]|nr:polysaccharide deacetylase family protein [Paenibacillus shirakamiensis]
MKWLSIAIVGLVVILVASQFWTHGTSGRKLNNVTPVSVVNQINVSLNKPKADSDAVNIPTTDTALLPVKTVPYKSYYRNKVIVLMYHEVTPEQIDSGTVLSSKFKRQLALMKAYGFKYITMKQYTDFILKGTPVPDNAVLMTFDDGYESFYQYAYPILKENNIPATMFLIANTVSNPKHPGIPKVSWEQIADMHKNGIDFYNHTFDSHVIVPVNASHSVKRPTLQGPIYLDQLKRKETIDEFKARVKKDLSQAQTLIKEKLGNDMDVLAFPYGSFSKTTLDVCKELGIQITFTVKPGINKKGQLNGFRVNAGGDKNNPDALIQLMKNGVPEPKVKKTRSPFDLMNEGPVGTFLKILPKQPDRYQKHEHPSGKDDIVIRLKGKSDSFERKNGADAA